jgi:hypothetical protein
MNLPEVDSISGSLRTAIDTGQARVSFSQLGEDAVLWWMFHDRFNGFYVDVGCHHPYRFSNTAALHIFNGWRGINVDVDERAIAAFNKVRPNDVNLSMAVGPKAERREVTLFEDGAVNSLDAAAAANPAWAYMKHEKRLVDVHPLSAILDQYVPAGQSIDLLNVDAEGLDFSILSSNDWSKYLPEVIAVEVHGFNPGAPQQSQIFTFLSEKGYALISHLVVTSIYRKKM